MANYINKCKNSKIGFAYCCFTKVEDQEITIGKNFKVTRKVIPEYNCTLCRSHKDEYNMYPSTSVSKDGEIWTEFETRSTSNPFASRIYQFEALTNHQVTGDEFSLNGRRFDQDHPLYHMIDYDVPMNRNGDIAPFEQATIMGINDPMLISNRWHEDVHGQPKRAIGRSKIQRCTGIYGTIDKRTGIITHKSMRNHFKSFSWWQNYTSSRVMGTKAVLNIYEDDMDTVEAFLMEKLQDETIVVRIIEAYLSIKNGNYINLYLMLKNNGLDRNKLNMVLKSISTIRENDLYSSSTGNRYNMDKINELFKFYAHDKEIACNIVNYILNDRHGFLAIDPTVCTSFHSSRKYWKCIEIVEKAVELGYITNLKGLPKDFIRIWKAHQKRRFSYTHTDMKRSHVDATTPDSVMDDLAETLVTGLQEPFQLYPAMRKISDICEITEDQKDIFNVFSSTILQVVNSICPTELKLLWHYFEVTYRYNQVQSFWKFIYEVMTTNRHEDELSIKSIEESNNWASDIWNAGVHEESWYVEIRPKQDSPYFPTKRNFYTEQADEFDQEQQSELLLSDPFDEAEEYEASADQDDEFLHLPNIEGKEI